ncbi:MAG: Crp/Fnr family transcriptional regulator [Acidimicrobiia bacterium]|nr:Crp/Fnr family transcriptional regulator [Microthrixaceae bacterium]RTL08321.1 MAG: Crp/Fnr family transcriptional regulator [Acidimicrobiia bacterium]
MADMGMAPFLPALNRKARSELDRMGTRRTFAAGTTILAEGELAGRVGILREGLVKLTSSQTDGYRTVLALRGVGELLGEMSAIDGRPRSASVDALVRCSVQLVSAEEFVRFVGSHPSASMAVMRTLVARLRESDHHRVQFASDGVPRRLARRLLQLADSHGRVADDCSIDISLPFTQDDLAGTVSASRDAVARALKDWRALGLITTGRRRITLVDPAGLSRLNSL